MVGLYEDGIKCKWIFLVLPGAIKPGVKNFLQPKILSFELRPFMSNRTDKPLRSSAELIAMLKEEKGITFNYMDTSEAEAYLTDRNNYLRTASYRKNYDKHRSGEKVGKYIHLDFAYLVELSRLDMYLRSHLLLMCIDIEHALKVAVVLDIERNDTEDGYSIVNDFLAENHYVLDSIAHKANSVFTGDLIQKYFDIRVVSGNNKMRTEILRIDCPVWVLVKILAFKAFLRFIDFYTNRYSSRMSVDIKLLNTVRNLRNACAHNNCILVSLRAGSTRSTPVVSQRIAKISTIAYEERKNKLSCRPLFEIACLLIEYEHWVAEPLKSRRLKALKEFANGRMISYMGFFSGNPVISTAIFFLKKMIDNFA